MSAYPFEFGEYVALAKSCGVVAMSGWSSITFTGADRQAFLHSFSTNDIRRLSPGEGCEAFITNVRGRIIGHGLVTCRENELVFTTVPGQATTLLAHFELYIIREDVQVVDSTETRALILIAGDSPAARGTVVALAPTIEIGKKWLQPGVNGAGKLVDTTVHWLRWDLLGPTFCGLLEFDAKDIHRSRQALIDRGPSHPCSMSAFHALRIEAGTPLFGVDFDDRNFPQEVDRNEQAISFTKGCYLGQETVARIDALGHVNQQLAGVKFAGSVVPKAGAELTQSGKRAGRVTSATFSPRLRAPLALAMLRRENASVGSRLESAAGPCEVIPLPVTSTQF
jgi:folate-binding protein YgfZ